MWIASRPLNGGSDLRLETIRTNEAPETLQGEPEHIAVTHSHPGIRRYNCR